MYRTFVIVRHTFVESIVQPIYSLLIGLGSVIILVFAALPFFTLGEDTVMFKSVGLDVIMLLALLATLFAASRTIYDEIEDRTMLTLMSKPIAKWEVLVGKYLGIILAALLAAFAMGLVLTIAIWLRIPTDYQLNTRSLDERDLREILEYRMTHIFGLGPAIILLWLQISVLAAISVAISTRVSLVVNLPVVILIYIAGNLTRFLFPLANGKGGVLDGRNVILKGFAYTISVILPYLENFDLRQKTVYSRLAIPNTVFALDVNSVKLGEIWSYTGYAGLYAFCYASLALAVGMWLFQGRELGGGEG